MYDAYHVQLLIRSSRAYQKLAFGSMSTTLKCLNGQSPPQTFTLISSGSSLKQSNAPHLFFSFFLFFVKSLLQHHVFRRSLQYQLNYISHQIMDTQHSTSEIIAGTYGILHDHWHIYIGRYQLFVLLLLCDNTSG